jgi:EamA domain-containing membrane protein RarD
MRLLFVILAVFFAVIGIVFTILPLGTLALIPIVFALIFSALGLYKSEGKLKLFPKLILIISAVAMLVVIGKEVFIKDEVAADNQINKIKVESKKEAVKDLEGLE